ncbi:MAG: AAA family ATPase [Prolixibacteraceae bacterium]|nr:AAA family ATPase [Prolixibacteraceae bacterium]
MQLKRLYIKEYKLFRDFTYEFPADSKHFVNVLIGINGSGKSTILEAIAEIFSCVVLGEKSKFGFKLEYVKRYESTSLKSESGMVWNSIQFKEIHITAGDKGQVPELKIMPEKNDDNDVFYKVPPVSQYQFYLPQSIVIYYSGYSKIMKILCEPHNDKLSRNLRKGESTPVQFYYHEPKLFNVILLSLLAYEYGEIPIFLKEKAKIVGVEIVQIKLRKPYWDKTGSLNDFWGATGEVKTFLEFIQENLKNKDHLELPLTDKFPKNSFIFDAWGNEHLNITIVGQKKLFELRDFLIEEKNLFKILHTMYLDDLLDDISFSLIKEENGERKTFSILSEGEQQSITIKGLAELLAGENTLFLFDEPDTFLHPKWQRSFISEIEENVELNHTNEISYLIATHSPQLLSNANPDKTFVKIIENGQLVEQTPKHYGREISSILYNLMGVEERNETIRKDLSKLFMLIEDEEIKKAEKMLKDLTDILGDTDADIQNAAIQLNYLKEDEAD